jgi:C4-dicarboxylate transporter DctM subunit
MECCGDAALATVGCMVVIMVSTALSYVLARLGLTEMISNFCHSHIASPVMFLVFVIIINIISGCFIDANAWMMMMLPILWPIMLSYGISELQFGLVFVVSLLTGGITPPVGMYLLIICGVDGTPLKSTFKYIVPFLICELVVIALMTAFPIIPEFIPRLLGFI